MRSRPVRAFTLVELLVVIGIIALLISILLPALNSARRQANAVKCLTQLREIGNAFQMYAIDSKGYYPPAQLRIDVDAGAVYNLYGDDFPVPNTTTGAYWFNFLNKYVSRAKIGATDEGGTEIATTKTRSIFWGCPSWEGYSGNTSTIGTNQVQTGFGMNGYPTFTATYPKGVTTGGPIGPPVTSLPATPPQVEWAWNDIGPPNTLWNKGANHKYGFVKQKIWTRNGSERCLIADSRFWLAQASPVSTATGIPAQNAEENENGDAGETTLFMWRHGKVPSSTIVGGKRKFPLKGKFAYNILYADNHVATATEPKEAYKSLRMKFPG